MPVEQITHEIRHWSDIGYEMVAMPGPEARRRLGHHLIDKSLAKADHNGGDLKDTVTETLETDDAACVRRIARHQGHHEVSPRDD